MVMLPTTNAATNAAMFLRMFMAPNLIREFAQTNQTCLPGVTFLGTLMSPSMNHKLISKKKKVYPVLPPLQAYLDQHGRAMSIPISYEDLLRFEGSVAILDKNDQDTLWVDCLYPQGERDELVTNLKRLYSILHATAATPSFRS